MVQELLAARVELVGVASQVEESEEDSATTGKYQRFELQHGWIVLLTCNVGRHRHVAWNGIANVRNTCSSDELYEAQL